MTRYTAMLDGWLEGKRLAPILKLLGARLLHYAPGEATLQLDADERLHNALGTVHGGVYCDLADIAFGCALASTLDPPVPFATASLNAAYFRPLATGTLEARATITHRGKRAVHLACDVTDAEGTLLARVTSVYVLLDASA